MDKPFILGINGSPNKKGKTSRMLASVVAEAKRRGARTLTVDLADYKILPHGGKLDEKIYIERTRDDIPKLQKLVLEADGIVFATPTHWFNMSSLMKLFVDRLTSLEHYGFLLEGKAAGIISYGPEGGALVPAMLLAAFAIHMGMAIPPYCLIFDEGRNEKWPKFDAQVMAKNILRHLEATKQMEINWGYPEEKYKISPIELLPKKKFNRK